MPAEPSPSTSIEANSGRSPENSACSDGVEDARILHSGRDLRLFPLTDDELGIGKIHMLSVSLYRGPDRRFYMPRWDLCQKARYALGVFRFFMQPVERMWPWCAFIYVATESPIATPTLQDWEFVGVSTPKPDSPRDSG